MAIKSKSQTENLLTKSVEQYRVLLLHVEQLVKTLDECDYSQVNDYTLRLQQLQAVAKKQDEQLLPLLIADFTTWKESTLYQLRMEYINSILRLNELLVPKIQGVMAVTSVELKKMHGGRSALAGYAPKTAKHQGLRGIG